MKKAKLKDVYAAANYTSEQLQALARALELIERQNYMLAYHLRNGLSLKETAAALSWNIRSARHIVNYCKWPMTDIGMKATW